MHTVFSNPINISGKGLEWELKVWLDTNRIPYTKSVEGPKGDIDFIIHTDTQMYIECANQNRKGSVMDKIPHKVFKYWNKHKMKKIHILRGSYNKFSKSINKHLELISSVCDIEITICDIKELQNELNNITIKENKFF